MKLDRGKAILWLPILLVAVILASVYLPMFQLSSGVG